jgi:hypothetical protein
MSIDNYILGECTCLQTTISWENVHVYKQLYPGIVHAYRQLYPGGMYMFIDNYILG